MESYQQLKHTMSHLPTVRPSLHNSMGRVQEQQKATRGLIGHGLESRASRARLEQSEIHKTLTLLGAQTRELNPVPASSLEKYV